MDKNNEKYIEETPLIVIESNDDNKPSATTVINVGHQHRWRWVAASALAALLVVLALVAALGYWRYYIHLGVPVSVSPEENIAKLEQPLAGHRPKVVMTSDSILGVRLNFYKIEGLRAEFMLDEPSPNDKSVYLYAHAADYDTHGTPLGSLVINGKEKSNDQSRLGYFAAVGNHMVIGVSRYEDVKDYAVKHKGHFFRQFILVSDGVLPPRFQLHGKVERRALGRIGDTLYYIEAPNPETMWDFADALREYGFVDAIYMTGGDAYSYYRDSKGEMHAIGKRHTPHRGATPWLVFKTRK
ncbi:MAG: hypothetical protein KBT10_07225 [Bacteroidales bacterium]|nr:hypothetical protein [Candidatus Sodaliphilus aphodohippi]